MSSNLEQSLSTRLPMGRVRHLAAWVCEDKRNREALLQCALSNSLRVANNALWIMSHLPESEAQWLSSLRQPLTDLLLQTANVATKRHSLRLLREMEWTPNDFSGELLDFCLQKIPAESEPYAIRCFSLYLAYKMCRHYRELLAELQLVMDMLTGRPLSPGMSSAMRQTQARMHSTLRRL